MRVRARHTVSYKGKFYTAGKEFVVDESDSVMMSEYCDLLGPEPVVEAEPEKRRGRPRKEAAE